MMLLAGFDGGQTSIRCRLSQWDDGRWLLRGEGRGPGVTHLEAPDGEQRFRAAIRISFAEAGRELGDVHIAAAVIGASGIEQGTPVQQRASVLLSEELRLDGARSFATGDERTALRGAFPEGAGIVLISGTGMICLGRNEQGSEHRCGGWGWLLDGGGSAFDLGHQGLQLCLKMADGRLPEHQLRQEIWRSMGCDSSAAVKARAVQPDFGAAGFAALAPLLVAAAEQGLEEAEAIVRRSAATLSASAETVASRLHLTSPRLVTRGGALDPRNHFSDAVKAAIDRRLPQARWTAADGDACQGALVMAKELAFRLR